MDKNIRKVRKSIEQRKKMRGKLPETDNTEQQILSPLPQEEEKHGYYPVFTETPPSNVRMNHKMFGFVMKGICSVVLFFAVALLLQSNQTYLSEAKEWTNQALTDEFPFAKVNLWYQETFGSPLAFSSGDRESEEGSYESAAMPVMGDVQETFQVNGKGIMITPQEESIVSAMHDGIIIFSGNDRDTNQTIVVQHADGSETTYGNLSDTDVHLYQFVSANQKIGTFIPNEMNESVYFSIEKDDQYIDPVQVMQVDDTP